MFQYQSADFASSSQAKHQARQTNSEQMNISCTLKRNFQTFNGRKELIDATLAQTDQGHAKVHRVILTEGSSQLKNKSVKMGGGNSKSY